MRIAPIPCLSDNYAYLVIAENGDVAIVDPSEIAPVRAALARSGLSPTEVWCTHHHMDHVGAVPELCDRHPNLVVRGSAYDRDHLRIAGQTVAHRHGETFDFGGATVKVLGVPGHTLGAIAFLVEQELFSGDTLFLGGCGRVFEGTMPMMASAMRTLRALDPKTRIWCGHEYTAANLRFARHVEPENEAIMAALEDAEAAVAEGRATIPGTIARELETNPFFRFDRPELAAGLEGDASFTRLREAKNSFRG